MTGMRRATRATVVFVGILVAGCAGLVPSNPPSSGSAAALLAPSASTAPSASPVGTTSPVAGAASPAPTAIARDDGWLADIDALLEAREAHHPHPWYGMERATWVAAADGVKARVPTLTDGQVFVELLRLAAMPGWAGRDGHTGIFRDPARTSTRSCSGSSVTVWSSPRARPYGDLVGSRIETIEGRPIADVLALVEPLVPRDNPSNLLAVAPLYLRIYEVLSGLGVVDTVDFGDVRGRGSVGCASRRRDRADHRG